MLKTLTVSNFALIEKVAVEFTKGLNILTGETGAGKSILIDALNVILGGRSSVDLIRTGCDSFRIEAVFDISKISELSRFCYEMGVDIEEDVLILTRRLTKSGKNTILINGVHITLGILRQIGEFLVDMHGQHENQTLLNANAALLLIDQSKEELKEKLFLYQKNYGKWLDVEKSLSEIEKNARERAQRVDMLKWQTQEIAAANLQVDEEEELAQKIRVLSNAEKISEASNKAYTLLSQGYKGTGSLVSTLGEVIKHLEFISRYDKDFEAIVTTAQEMFYQLEDVSMEIRNHMESFEYDSSELIELQQRMDNIHKLKKKYGDSTREIIEFYHNAVKELETIENHEIHLLRLSENKSFLQKQLTEMAEDIHNIRVKVSQEMSYAIQQHLSDLGMPNARFKVDVNKVESFTPQGSSEAIFLFSANPGEKIRPLQRVASGGELSRIALAIKTATALHENVGSMVFDEIDTGIGGKTAQKVAEKIAQVSINKQVLCITHLPQIASMADSHIYIEKLNYGEKTVTSVRTLSHKEQLTELARMSTGNDSTHLAIENAAEMLENAKMKKREMAKMSVI